MNILEQEDIIKGLPDQALMKEASAPSGQVPQFLVVSEIKRRSDMRKRYQEQQQQPQGTVKDQIVMEAMGIGGVMPPQMAPQQPPMAPAGAPPMGGMPPMAPPMPQAGIASAPQGMPPMGMAQGGIVKMSGANLGTGQVPGIPALPAGEFRLFDGATIADRMADLIARVRRGELAYADVLADISSLPASDARDVALSYVQSEVGGKRAYSPESKFRMDEGMFGYSDRDARVMGTMEAPLPAREDYPAGQQGREAFSKAFTDTLDFNDAIYYGADGGGIGSLPTEKDIAGARSAFMGRTIMPPVGDARTQAIESAEVQSGPALTARQRVQEQRGGDPLFTDFSLGTGRGTRRGLRELEQQALDDSQLRISRYGIPSILSDLTDYTTLTDKEGKLLFPAVAADEVAAQSPFSLEYLERQNAIAAAREAARNEDFSTFAGKDIDRTAGAGTETTKGERTPATRATDAVTALPRNDRSDRDMPALDFSDLIAESKQQALANAMIQLGAGVASGDISKGLAAAGTAAMEGTADARALDMKRRLAEYQAGREDIRRGDETSRYKEGMDLKREQFDTRLQFDMAKLDAEIDQSNEVTRRSLITSIPDLIREANDEITRLQQFGSDEAALSRITDLQDRIESLYKQYEKYSTMPSRGKNRFSGYSLVGQR
jgi:hypothetical protein